MPARDRTAYDVVVVGGGPGGSTAAYQLQQFGHDVLLIDRETFPRDKLCGGLITYKTLRLLDRVFDESESHLVDEGILNFGADEYAAYFNDDLVLRDSIDVPFYFAKRFEYDEFLHDRAVEAGVDTHLGDGVSRIDIEGSTVETTDGETFTADYIVGADGASSRIRSQLADEGLVDTSGWRKNLAIAAEAYVPRDAIDVDIDYPMLHFGVLDWGYGWVFPNTDRLLVGVGGLNAKNDRGFRRILDDYFDLLGFDYDPDTVKGHPIPFGNYLDRPAHGNVLLVGDAAGTVDAITGEGIFYAQRSGELAAWAIDRAESGTTAAVADDYTDMLHEYVHPELHHSKQARLFIWGGPQFPRRLAMKAWFALLSDPSVELVHGIRIYDLLRRRGDVMHETLPGGTPRPT
ncbi:geranylgeranyl reductase family protein [Haloplanus aerogenes]|nr:geranylgeranyl reductase family protein [Haloplanus aerogenes]RMB25242.1 geranylgeranyl reductase family protein [Haloplanus aerogenes]